jgi:hypothetical protein
MKQKVAQKLNIMNKVKNPNYRMFTSSGLKDNMSAKIKTFFVRVNTNLKHLTMITAENYIEKQMLENPRYQNPKKLNKYERQVYSQNGEDGIISEIFKRIGTGNKFFVEFGVGTGMENNTTYLLLKGYNGFWIEGNKKLIKNIDRKFYSLISNNKLIVRQSLVTAENIENLFKEANVPKEFDFLSIDIDGNDYWIWKALENYHPRVVAIEYNALFPPDVECVIRYNPHFSWNGTSYHGASLKALENLGVKKGYNLVGCDFRGINAFFVRKDLVSDKFLEPFTAENHYEPIRFHYRTTVGYPRDFGDFEFF